MCLWNTSVLGQTNSYSKIEMGGTLGAPELSPLMALFFLHTLPG